MAPLLALTIVVVPVVIVEQAPGCPDAETVAGDLTFALQSVRPRPLADGRTLRVRIDLVDDRLALEVTSPSGESLRREIEVSGQSCGARSRAIAAVVERWIADLSLPRPPARRYEAPLTRSPDSGGTGLGVRLGPFVDARTAGVGLDLGAGLRLGRLRLAADVRAHMPQEPRLETGQAEVNRESIVARVLVAPWRGSLEGHVGASARLHVTTVSTAGFTTDGSETRASPAFGAVAAASLRLLPRLAIDVSVEAYATTTGHSFYVATPTGAQEVHRTPAWGLELLLIGSFEVVSD